MPVQIEKEQDLLSMKVTTPINDYDLQYCLQYLSTMFGLKEKFFLLTDLTNIDDVPYKFVISLSLYLKKMEIYVRKYLGASTIVLNSKSIANVIDSFTLVKKPVSPNLVTQDFVSAIEFLTKHKIDQIENAKIKNTQFENIESVE